MTDQSKRNFERWLPHLITILVLAGGGLLSYGGLNEKMNSANEKIEAVKEQNAALWKEIYYLRKRIDGSADAGLHIDLATDREPRQ